MKASSKKKHRLVDYLLNSLIILFLLLSLAFIFHKTLRNWLISSKSGEYQITRVSAEQIEQNKTVETTFDFDQVESLSTEAVLAAQWDSQELPVIGGIAIPELAINLPIFKGMSNTALYFGAGTMKEDQEMGKGNYSLASHHLTLVPGAEKVLFTPLDRAKEGMLIYITDKQSIHTYQITSVEIVWPDRIDVIDDVEGVTEITLVTCEDSEATKRIIVKGVLKESIPYKEASKEMKKAFNISYNQVKS